MQIIPHYDRSLHIRRAAHLTQSSSFPPPSTARPHTVRGLSFAVYHLRHPAGPSLAVFSAPLHLPSRHCPPPFYLKAYLESRLPPSSTQTPHQGRQALPKHKSATSFPPASFLVFSFFFFFSICLQLQIIEGKKKNKATATPNRSLLVPAALPRLEQSKNLNHSTNNNIEHFDTRSQNTPSYNLTPHTTSASKHQQTANIKQQQQ